MDDVTKAINTAFGTQNVISFEKKGKWTNVRVQQSNNEVVDHKCVILPWGVQIHNTTPVTGA